MLSKSFRIKSLSYAFILIIALCLLGGGVKAQQPCDNLWQTSNNIGIHNGLLAPSKALHIFGKPECPDPAIRLSYEAQPVYTGHLALLTPGNLNIYTQLPFIDPITYLPIQTSRDVILQADTNANDIIITTRNDSACIRFATTPFRGGPDIERMTILPNGQTGIFNNNPKEALQIGSRLTFHIGSWYNFIGFNDYVNLSSERKRIDNGYAECLEFRDGYLQLTVAPNSTQGTTIDYTEGSTGLSGISMNLGQDDKARIGIGRGPGLARLIVQGLGTTSSTNAFEIVNETGSPLFVVRDDGNVGIGVSSPQVALVVNGTICSREIRTQLSGLPPCYLPDFVFDDDYKLMPLLELEKQIKKDKHLPGIITAEEAERDGIALGEMQVKLLQKIEELTLYVIDLKKENEAIKKEIINLKQGDSK